MMKAKEIMSKNIIALKPRDTLFTIINKLSVAGISGAPVTVGKRVIGVVSESDIVDALDVHTKINFSSLPQFAFVVAALESKKHSEFKSEMRFASHLRAEDLMSKNPVCVHSDESVEQVARKMNSNDINRVCVVDKKRNLVGIITRSDIVKALAKL